MSYFRAAGSGGGSSLRRREDDYSPPAGGRGRRPGSGYYRPPAEQAPSHRPFHSPLVVPPEEKRPSTGARDHRPVASIDEGYVPAAPPAAEELTVEEEFLLRVRQRDVRGVKSILESQQLSPALLTLEDPEDYHRTPLHVAVASKDNEMIRLLVDAGCPVNVHFDEDGHTPLSLAMDLAASSVEYMMENGKGTNLGGTDAVGRNLIHRLAGAQSTSRNFDRLTLMKWLVEKHSVDQSAYDEGGSRPIDYARRNFVKLGSEEQARSIINWLEEPMRRKKGGDALRQARSGGPRFILCHPWVRIFTLIVLLVLHSLSYAVDTYGRTEETARFKFVFDVLNLIGASWPTENSALLVLKLMCIIFGFGLGILVAALFHWLVLRKLLRLRIFAAPGSLMSDEDGTRWRGILFVVFYCCFVGVYCGGLVFNAWLPRFRDRDQGSRMHDDAGFTNLQANKIFLTMSILFDVFILLHIIDGMMQMATARSSKTPFQSFNTFGSALQPGWRIARYPFFWCLFLAACFAVIFILATDAIDYRSNVLSANDPSKVAVSGLCLLVTVIVMIQDWLMPYLLALPSTVYLPGFPLGSNSSWLLWWCCSVLLALDGRMTYTLLVDWISRETFAEHLVRFELAMSLLPCFFAICILLMTIVSNMDRCCFADKSTAVVSPEDEDEELRTTTKHVGKRRPSGSDFHSLSARQESEERVRRKFFLPALASSPNRSGRSASPPRHHSLSRSRTADIWTAAFNDDVIKICSMLDTNPGLINQRGGIGLFCSRREHRVQLCPSLDENCSATPLHYALAGNAANAAAALLSKGANPKIRTSCGMWTAREIALTMGNEQFLDL